MKKEYTIIDKDELFSFLDGFLFSNTSEIELAIGDFIGKQEGKLYYSDGMLACELASEYKEYLDNQN